MFDGELISIEQFIQILFGKMPAFFKDEADLRTQWANPKTREDLLANLKSAGFSVDKLRQIQKLTNSEKCDLLDVLELIAYQISPMERAARVKMVHDDIMRQLADKQKSFVEFVLQQYVDNGVDELSFRHFPELVKLKYGTVKDACAKMGVDVKTLNRIFTEFQETLYG